MTAGDLASAAVEAIRNAVRQGERAGFRHRLAGRVSLAQGQWNCGAETSSEAVRLYPNTEELGTTRS